MTFTRRPAHQITPSYEDSGLFKSDVCVKRFDLLPIMTRNSRSDLVVTGLMDKKHLIPVVFAGRRRRHADALVTRLDQLRNAAPANGSADSFARLGMLLPVEVEGAWRRLVVEDEDGLTQRIYHFIAASWTLALADGRQMRFGVPPAIAVQTVE